MNAALIRIDAKTAGGSDNPVFLASHDDRDLIHIDETNQWVPAIARLPQFAYDFFGGSFRGQITAPTAQFAVAKEYVDDFDALSWADARVRVWHGDLSDTAADEWRTLHLDFLTDTYSIDRGGDASAIGPLALRYDGRLTGEPQVDRGVAQFSARTDDAWLDEPLLDLFEGTGGIEGFDNLEGVPKPRVFGNVRFAPGVLIDVEDNVYMVNDGAVQGINAAYDRLASLGSSTGDYANLAALIAASIPAGSWGTCKALGLVRLGAPADGTVSFDVSGDNVSGYVRLPGEMIGRIAEIAGGTVSSANLDALDTERPWNLQLVLSQQTTARQAIQQIADSVAAVAGVSWLGTLFAAPLSYGTADLTFSSEGAGDYPTGDVAVQPIGSPFWRLATYAEPTWVVHTRDEIATGYIIRGEYDDARVYRADDLVFSDDGRAFIYINATPAAGNDPPTSPDTSNSYWTLFGAADNTAANTPRHEPADASLPFTANYQGILDGGQLPATVQFKRYRGTTDVSASATWTLVSQGSITGGTVTVTNGVVTIPDTCDIPPSTTITVKSERDGLDITSTISVTRADAAPPVSSGGGGGSGGGTSATDNSLNAVSGTTKIAVSDVMTVKTGSGGTITFAGNLALSVLRADPEGTFGVAMRWKYRPVGGSFSDVGASDITETSEAAVYYDAELDFYLRENGAVNVAPPPLTALTALTDYEVQLWGARDSSSPAKDVFFSGTVSATGS